MTDKTPNPGSKEAIEAGCGCPVMDNHHGDGIPMVDPDTKQIRRAYWVDATCPMHGDKSGISVVEEQQGN